MPKILDGLEFPNEKLITHQLLQGINERKGLN